MTWVVGYNALFGEAYLISDIQITATVGDEVRYFDCCQKIYPLTRFIAGGFAGSARIGFEVLAVLQRAFAKAPDDSAWCLDEIAATWLPKMIKEIFDNAPPEEQAAGSEIILVSAHPTKDRGDAPWAETQIAKFRFPEFEPGLITAMGALSIGSGAAAYSQRLEELGKNMSLMQAAVAGHDAYGNTIYSCIQRMFDDNPTAGVSPYYQVMAINRGGFREIGTFTRSYAPDGTVTEHRTPPTVAGYEKLVEHISSEIGGAAIKCLIASIEGA